MINKLPAIPFSAVTRIRLIIIITFGATIVVVHKGITFGAGIRVVNHDCDVVIVVPCAQDSVPFIPYPNDSVTNGNIPQKIVSHFVEDQVILL